MEKKLFVERLRNQLEQKIKTCHPDITVKINRDYTQLVVVFPPVINAIFYAEMDIINQAGRAVWISFVKDHFEVDVRIFYGE